MLERTPAWMIAALALLAVLVLAGGFLAARGAAPGALARASLPRGLVSLEVARIERALAPGDPAPTLAPGEELVQDGAERLVVSARRAFDLADVSRAVDGVGHPALLAEVRDAERADLEAWTAAHVGDIVLLRVSGVTSRPEVLAPIPSGRVLLARSAVEPARYQRELLALLRSLGR